jgi:predicted pyridoxine 5'-phosphate oxidase superfamily flavin-nucleotide-binding protein
MKIPIQAKEIASKDPVVYVATSDKEGTPHIAAARGLQVLDDESVAFEDWFCMQTLRNIEENPKIALSLLESGAEHGYQLIGTVVHSTITELLDGYLPSQEQRHIPQAKHRLHIKVEKVLSLSTGPHSDGP